MLGGLGNLGSLFKQAKEFQSKMSEMQNELAAMRYDGESGGGAVVATVDGKGTLVNIKIQPDAASDVELLEDLITSAVRVAATKAHDAVREQMTELTGGLNVPGLADMFGGTPGE